MSRHRMTTPFGWLAFTVEAGDAVERLIATPQALEHQRFDGFPHGEVAHVRVWARRLVDAVSKATFVAHACDKAEVIQDWWSD